MKNGLARAKNASAFIGTGKKSGGLKGRFRKAKLLSVFSDRRDRF